MSTAPLALDLALVSAAILGFRHGFDYDHIAAITDITSVQQDSKQAIKLGLMYAVGHAATVAVLGMAVILFQLSLPSAVDPWMEHMVGVTLFVLGVYVLWTTFSHHHTKEQSHAPRTRITVLINAMLWCLWRVQKTFSSKPVERYRLFAEGLGKAPALVVGVIHGLGAETPSQLFLFLLAANLGGVAKGVLGLAAFIVGMLVMNTLMCATATGLFRASFHRPRVSHWVAGFGAAYSIVLGVVFIVGTSSVATALGR